MCQSSFTTPGRTPCVSQLTGVSSAMPMGANGMHAYQCTGCSAKGNMQLPALAKKPVKPTETTPGVAQCRCCMEALHCSAALQCRIAVRHGIHLVTRCCCSALHEHWPIGHINIKQMHLGQTLRAWKGWGRTNQTSLSDQLTEWQRHAMTEYQAPGTNTYSGLH
jgi:hypothetical protein